MTEPLNLNSMDRLALAKLREDLVNLSDRVRALEDHATKPANAPRPRPDGPPHCRYYHPRVRTEVVRSWDAATRGLDMVPSSVQAAKVAERTIDQLAFRCEPPHPSAVAHWFAPGSSTRRLCDQARASMGDAYYDLQTPIELPDKAGR